MKNKGQSMVLDEERMRKETAGSGSNQKRKWPYEKKNERKAS